MFLDVLTAAAFRSLGHHNLEDAVFLAELVHSEARSLESTYLLGVCYYRSGRLQQARYLLAGKALHRSPPCDLLYARCCLELGDYQAGLVRLRGLLCVGECSESDMVAHFGEDAGEAFFLLGELNKRLQLHEEAAKHYRCCLQYNPFLWSAYKALCQMGEDVSPDAIFKTSAGQLPLFLHGAAGSDVVGDAYTQKGVVESARHQQLPEPQQSSIGYSHAHSETRPSTITPLNSRFFASGVLGNAVASSTPALSRAAVAVQDRGSANHPPIVPVLDFDSERGLRGAGAIGQRDPSSTVTPVMGGMFGGLADTSSCKNKLSQKALDFPEVDSLPSSEALNTPQDIREPAGEMGPPCPLRRSTRLGQGLGKSPSSMAISQQRRERMASATLSKSRVKSTRIKTIEREMGKKLRVASPSPLTLSFPQVHKPIALSPNQANPLQQENQPQIELLGLTGDAANNETSKPGDQTMDVADSRQIQEQDNLFVGVESALSLLQSLGTAFRALCKYELVQAVRLFQALPAQHKESSWALHHSALAFVFGEKFKEAARLFQQLHKKDPHRQEGMDTYASVLWHLREEIQLSILVEDLTSSNKLRPESLCAMAALMNLYKDHGSAVRFLQRAVQVAPRSPYPHAVLGLECTLIKDHDKAMAAFQTAVNIDPRHYKAWYGMGFLYLQQENLDMAEVCARRALAINSSSSITCTQLAKVYQAQEKLDQALATIDRAIAINSSNHLPKLQRAQILDAMGRHQEALEQLQKVAVSQPAEPMVHKMMSKLLMKLGRPEEATLRMAWSLDYTRMHGAGLMGRIDHPGTTPSTLRLDNLDDVDFSIHSDVVEQES